MALFKRSVNAEKKWHKNALFVSPSRTRIVLVVTTEQKLESVQSLISSNEPYSIIEELLELEQYGLLPNPDIT